MVAITGKKKQKVPAATAGKKGAPYSEGATDVAPLNADCRIQRRCNLLFNAWRLMPRREAAAP
jgi:hypothetical protein